MVVDGPAPAWCPPAAWTPYELRVAHRSTRARFDEATDAEIGGRRVGTARRARRASHALLGEPPYNLVVHTAPPGRRPASYHWYVDVLPRTGVVAGFEQGTGIFVNIVPPEQAATRLREARAMSMQRPPLHDHRRPPGHVWATVEDIATHTEWMADAEAIAFRTEQRTGSAPSSTASRVGPFTTTDVMTVTEWRPGVGKDKAAGRSRCCAERAPRRRGAPGARGQPASISTRNSAPGSSTATRWWIVNS